ncbi:MULTISPECIES: type I restriction endonuclease subunit R [unclassified Paenibacillus]|uniref:type I restriction endonuclease subunit R n=1 Tax=unclassified Paenibacillus TaxID=185978 RepID=UPI001AE586B8|nr:MULTISPECIES: type I restriction endonuclease subunit R [unclassified Paenibacillus]MBP1154640.1 type I restriction enzyme R subunit [Paenibacillus sp. PvP091]MBP1169976.1 type I restriction enzyme R subunit [Paenibacillus sp. PvR098]MBP2441004.1 type I restriction enzyme R subunit [Paenibacillus sp. PvP052]
MFTEDSLESVVLELLQDELGYSILNGYDFERDYHFVVLEHDLRDALFSLNPSLPEEIIEAALRKLTYIDDASLFAANQQFQKYLIEGVSIEVYGEDVPSRIVKVIDFDHPNNNTFLAINQFTVIHKAEKRPDVVVFVNGLPLVVIELKSTVREDATIHDGYLQIKTYQDIIKPLFHYNAFSIISDGVNARVGSITADYDRYMQWKQVDRNSPIVDEPHIAQITTLLKGMLQKERLLDIVRNFTFFAGGKAKIIAGYHQYFGMNKAIDSVVRAIDADKRGGVVWHTQGSGKSFSMVFLSDGLIQRLNNPTIVVVTDRNDLDEQIHGTFSSAADFLRQAPVRAESRENLIELLENRSVGGIFFTTIQKFTEETGLLSNRHDIIVIADEAHRSQYGIDPDMKIDKKTLEAELVYGYAKYLRDALPNATFIGFTGTPIDSNDKSTIGVFGELIDVYDMTQAKLDGATVDLHYENRLAKVHLDEGILDQIDAEVAKIESQGLTPEKIEKLKKDLVTMEAVIGDEDRLKLVVDDILAHYEIRKNMLKGKAMIVAYSRKIAYRMYQLIKEKSPEIGNKIGLVLSDSNKDTNQEMRDIIGNKQHRQTLANQFKDDNSDMKIAIVVDMWLTGFDVPSLDTMYIDKIMKEHNLMQAIARVNRVYKDKQAGLIVDYIGLSKYLKEALNTYTSRDKNSIPEIEKAKEILMTEVEILEGMFHGFDFSKYMNATPRERFELIQDGVEHVLKERTKEVFLKHVTRLQSAYNICATALDFAVRVQVSFFMAVKSFIVKVERDGMPDVEAFKKKITAMIEQAIIRDGDEVVSISAKKEKSLLSVENLEKIMAMKRKNVAATILKKLIDDKIKWFEQTNIVRSGFFSEKLKNIVERYNQAEDIDVLITQMIDIAKEIESALNEGIDMQLSPEEQAFYDALAKPELVKEHYQSDVLREMAKNLIQLISENKTPDWYKRNDAKANMRSLIKRLLKKYKYPPDEIPEATELVIKQAELQMKYNPYDFKANNYNHSLAAESKGQY